MPSWPIHIALASKLKIKYNLTDDFIIGNIMPDATDGFTIKNISKIIGHPVTHFNYQGPNRPPKNDVEKFLEVYKNKLSNPIVLGSLIHLLTDNYFNEYTYKNHIKSIDNKIFAILNDGRKINSVIPWKLKQEEFKKFGDYLILNNKLGDVIKITSETKNLMSDLDYQITNNDIDIIIDKINSFITRDVKISHNYKMFSEDELKNLFDECYNYLENITNNYLETKTLKLEKGK